MRKSTSSTATKAATTAPKQAVKARLPKAPQHEYVDASHAAQLAGALSHVARLRSLLELLEQGLLRWPVASNEWQGLRGDLARWVDAASGHNTKHRATHALVSALHDAREVEPHLRVAFCAARFESACPEYAAALRAPDAWRLLELVCEAWGAEGPKGGRPRAGTNGVLPLLFRLAEEIGIAPPEEATYRKQVTAALQIVREWAAYKSGKGGDA